MYNSNRHPCRARTRGYVKAELQFNKFTLKSELLAQIQQLRSLSINDSTVPILVRYPIAPSSLLDWLEQKKMNPKFYFQTRSKYWEIAGIGQHPIFADSSPQLENWHQLQAHHPAAEHLRLFFCRNFSSDETWTEFSFVQNVLPMIYRERIGDAFFETRLIPLEQAESLNTLLLEIERDNQTNVSSTAKPQPLPALHTRVDTPNYAAWERNVESVLAEIKKGTIAKVVLGRRTDFQCEQDIPFSSLMQALQAIPQKVYHYAYQAKAGHTFLGASPERLFSLADSQIQTEAVAGTVGHLADESPTTLYSEKNVHEHRFVVDGIKERLQKIASHIVTAAAPTALPLADMTHLRSKIAAKAHAQTSMNTILETLHPTAAVCGTPRNAATQLITQLERFSRGLYAAPIGVVRGNDVECAVALRCCLMQGRRVSFYTGAGIVQGSSAAAEWRELETKMATLHKLFS